MLTPQHKKLFYLLSQASDLEELTLELKQVQNHQTDLKTRSVQFDYEAARLDDLVVFFNLNSFTGEINLSDELGLTLAQETVCINDELVVSEYFYQEPLQQTRQSQIEETKTTTYLGRVYQNSDQGIRDGVYNLSRDLRVNESIRLEDSIYINDVQYNKQVRRARSLHNPTYQEEKVSGTYQLNFLPLSRGVAGFINPQTQETYLTVTLPGNEDGYLPGERLANINLQTTLETISYGLLLAISLEDREYLVSTLQSICAIARYQSLIERELDLYTLNPNVEPGFCHSYSRLDLRALDSAKQIQENLFLGVSLIESLYYLKNLPLEQQVELTGSAIHSIENQISAVLDSITEFLLKQIDATTNYLFTDLESSDYSLSSTCLAVVYLSRYLDLRYSRRVHIKAVEIDLALRDLPFDPNHTVYKLFQDHDFTAFVNLALYAYSTEQTERFERIAEILSLRQEIQPLQTSLYAANILRLFDPAVLTGLLESFLTPENLYNSVEFSQDPVQYFRSFNRTQLFSTREEALIYSLVSPRLLFATRGFDLHTVEADSSIQYLKQWFASSLPGGIRWFEFERALDTNSAIGVLNHALTQMTLPSLLSLYKLEARRSPRTAWADDLEDWSHLLFGSRPSFIGSAFWRGWLSNYQRRLRNLNQNLEPFLLQLGLEKIPQTETAPFLLTSDSESQLNFQTSTDLTSPLRSPVYPFIQNNLSQFYYAKFSPDGYSNDFELESLTLDSITANQMRYVANLPSFVKLSSNLPLSDLSSIWERRDLTRIRPGLPQRIGVDSTLELNDVDTLDQFTSEHSYTIEPIQTCPVIHCRGTVGKSAKLLQRILPLGTQLHLRCYTFSKIEQ
ncbi:hypothetical protein ACQ4M3_18960 [Leptolyngbya sp. AN03gr2]|uniref:hypothetical protein n=1 Tax=Leptolyngbya sp. AN03gr2 TaxID=3423364 RepID=UPI003D311501